MKFLIDLFITGLSILLAAYILPGAQVSGFFYALLAGVIIALVNATIGTILRFFTFPLNLLTLGLISFIITVLMVQLTSYFLKPNFVVDNFWWAAVFALLTAFFQMVFGALFGTNKPD